MHNTSLLPRRATSTLAIFAEQKNGKTPIVLPSEGEVRIDCALILATEQLQLIFLSYPCKCLPSAGHGSI